MHDILVACSLNRHSAEVNGCSIGFSLLQQTPGVGCEPGLTENCVTLCEEKPSARVKSWISHKGVSGRGALLLWVPSRDEADRICEERRWLRLLWEGVEGQPRKSLTFASLLIVTWVFLPGREVVGWGSWRGNRDQNHWPQSKHNREKDNKLQDKKTQKWFT